MRTDLTITLTPGPHELSCVGHHYFAVEGLDASHFISVLGIEGAREMRMPLALTHYRENGGAAAQRLTAVPVLLLPSGGWTFLLWRLDWYEECQQLADLLLSATTDRVNYFHFDPPSGTLAWTIGNRGRVIRRFRCHEERIVRNEGLPIEPEEGFREALRADQRMPVRQWISRPPDPVARFGPLFLEVVRHSGPHLEDLNRPGSQSATGWTGTVNLLAPPFSE